MGVLALVLTQALVLALVLALVPAVQFGLVQVVELVSTLAVLLDETGSRIH